MRVIVADHHTQVLRALVTMLGERPEIRLVAQATDSAGLLQVAATCAPDLILLDKQLPGDPFGEMIARLHQLAPSPFVIVMSTRADDSRAALEAGADSFVSKSDGSDWLLARISDYIRQRSVRRGSQE